MNSDNILIAQTNKAQEQKRLITETKEELEYAKKLGAPNSITNLIVIKYNRQLAALKVTEQYIDLLTKKGK